MAILWEFYDHCFNLMGFIESDINHRNITSHQNIDTQVPTTAKINYFKGHIY